MKRRIAFLMSLALPLAGCMNETASLQFSGPGNALTLQVRQAWPWDETADLEVVMARQPDCQRRSRLDSAALADLDVDVLMPDAGEFAEPILILRQGERFYALSTQNCELQRFKAPPEKPGARLGSFRLEGKRLAFAAAPAPGAPGQSAPASPPPQ